ncbi:hypothetical protein ILYODFUR_021070 [Ilyodon furcidens]|uniref:Uncharacterized protein n=1 Tax=Ilyodon furcidens TaxID=33524 RepID=A0ABV0SN13_9TELE
MAPGDVVPEHAKQQKSKDKRAGNRALKAECEPDGSFVFEAHEAWKDFHNSLRHFYEVGELCDVTLKVDMNTFVYSSALLGLLFSVSSILCFSFSRLAVG